MIELLRDPVAFTILAGLLGLFVGSFLNVVIHRLPKMMERDWHAQAAELRGEEAPAAERFNLATPRSSCPHCGHQITMLENIPLVSYLMLRGRCAHCGAGISKRYPTVEVLTALLSAFAAWQFGFGIAAAGALLFVWAMVALTFTDLPSAVAGAMAGYLVLWTVFWLFKLATGKEGMGYGDFKLLAAIGAWLGWQLLPLTILLSSLVGALVGIGLIVLGRHGRNVPIPFGPYLAAAGLIALFWGERITERYIGLL